MGKTHRWMLEMLLQNMLEIFTGKKWSDLHAWFCLICVFFSCVIYPHWQTHVSTALSGHGEDTVISTKRLSLGRNGAENYLLWIVKTTAWGNEWSPGSIWWSNVAFVWQYSDSFLELWDSTETQRKIFVHDSFVVKKPGFSISNDSDPSSLFHIVPSSHHERFRGYCLIEAPRMYSISKMPLWSESALSCSQGFPKSTVCWGPFHPPK